ncbi:hypothetical protein Plhal304r1_c049g0131361 [Plasmopara halstedii]
MIATARNGPTEIQFSSFLTQLKTPQSSETSMRSEGQLWLSPSKFATNSSDTITSQPLPSFTPDHNTQHYYATANVLPSRPVNSFSTPTGYYSQHVLPLRDQHTTTSTQSWSASTFNTGASMIPSDFLHHQHMPQQPALHPLIQHSETMPRQDDEDLAIDAQMLREVLQEMPTGQTPVGAPHTTQSRGQQIPGLQLLFVSPVHSTDMTSAPAQSPPYYSTSMGMTTTQADMLLNMNQTASIAPIYASVQTQDRTLAGTLPLPSGLTSVYDSLSNAEANGLGPTSALARKKRATAPRICKIEGCTKGIRSRGLCKAHGGGRRCTTPGCTTSDQGGGHCVLHGGGRRCRIEGCKKSAQWRGVCKMHGGARRCRYGQCTKNGQVKQGYCRMHHNLLTAQRQQQEQLQAQQLHSLHQPHLPSVVVKLATEGI